MTVTNIDLEFIQTALSNLKHFHIAGFHRVDNIGVWSILSASVEGLISLGLEGLSPEFVISFFCTSLVALLTRAQDYLALSNACKAHSSNPLRRLRSITASAGLSYIRFTTDLLDLLACSPLEKFQVYSTCVPLRNEPVPLNFLLEQIVLRHAQTLRRFSVNRIVVDHKVIQKVCEKCPNLEELFVSVDPLDFSKAVSVRFLNLFNNTTAVDLKVGKLLLTFQDTSLDTYK